MGYLHINNLYKSQEILLFRECYALEKIHGTSAHISFRWNLTPTTSEEIEYEKNGVQIHHFSGGTSHVTFKGLFNEAALIKAFVEMALPQDRELVMFGESYGGKEQGMSHTYGTTPKFIVFDVKIGEYWLDVPNAEQVAKAFGLEFVHYVKVSTDIKELDAQRDAPSVQAIRNGVSSFFANGVSIETILNPESESVELSHVLGGTVVNPRRREGIVVRPLKEVRLNNGDRVIAKHKGEAFQETSTPRIVADPNKLQKLADAERVANEWVTPMRLQHVIDKIPNHDMSQMPNILRAMVEDVLREGSGEIDLTDEKGIKKAISKRTVELYKAFLAKA